MDHDHTVRVVNDVEHVLLRLAKQDAPERLTADDLVHDPQQRLLRDLVCRGIKLVVEEPADACPLTTCTLHALAVAPHRARIETNERAA